MGVTAALRPVFGIVFAAFLALSLIATTSDAIAATAQHNGGSAMFDQGFVDHSSGLIKPRPIGRFGVTWE